VSIAAADIVPDIDVSGMGTVSGEAHAAVTVINKSRSGITSLGVGLPAEGLQKVALEISSHLKSLF
jgi:hypothetical protein